MVSLDELAGIEGVAVACEFSADGKLIDHKSSMDVPRELAEKASEYVATVTMLYNTLAGSFTQVSQMNWVPQHGWMYSGGDWTVAVGGNKAVFIETAKADFNKLFEVLVGGKREARVSQSI